MKTLTCDLCDTTAQGETFDDWMNALMPHYMQAHADVMQKKAGMTAEQMEADKAGWMADNKARFDAA